MRERIRRLLDETDTGAGRVLAWLILALILASCAAVIVETVPNLPPAFYAFLADFEMFAVVVFSLEYALRLFVAERPVAKAREPLMVIDLLAVAPFFIGLVAGGMIDLRVLRLLRTLRVLRLLKMQRYSNALTMLTAVVVKARHQLLSFLLVASICIVLMGSVIYQLEPETFGSIPKAIWWAVVTLTTVGYGEIVPQTPVARAATGALMLLGIGIIAIPTGIISSGMVEFYNHPKARACSACGLGQHDGDAGFCKACGAELGDA